MLLITLLTALAASGALAQQPDGPGISQTEAQELAAKAREVGSDASLRASVTGAMRALMKLGEKDVLGASSQAFKAYGGFKGAENLDRLRKQGLLAKLSLASPGTVNLSEEEVGFLGSPTSYRRLDPSFLSVGDDAKLAAEFEKKTGIRRKDFIEILASAAENKIYVSDPRLPEKVDAEFEGFLSKIPNLEFRAKVRESLGLVPVLARQKLLVQAMQGAIRLASKLREPAMSEQDLARLAGGAVPSVAGAEGSVERAPAAAEEAQGAGAAEDELSGALLGTLTRGDVGQGAPAEGSGGSKLQLDMVVGAALRSQAENQADSDSLFYRVSQRYQTIQRRGGP